MNDLLDRSPMDGWIRLSSQREPTFFTESWKYGNIRTVVVEALPDNKVVGMYAIHQFPVFINGREKEVGYLAEMRVHPEYRNKIRPIRAGYDAILKIGETLGVKHWFTSIATDNMPARRLLEAGISGLPEYRPAGFLTTLAVSVNHACADRRFRQARVEDISDIVAIYRQHASQFHFSPSVTENWFIQNTSRYGIQISDFIIAEVNGEIKACVALWDQRALRHITVKGYQVPLSLFRSVYNGYAFATKRPMLPPPGNSLDEVYLAFFTCHDQDPDLGVQLVRHALTLAKTKGAKIALFGLSSNNFALKTFRKCLKPTEYYTNIYQVSWDQSQVSALDSNSVQPEIALM